MKAPRGVKPFVPDWSPAGMSAVTASPWAGMSDGGLQVSSSVPWPRTGAGDWAAAPCRRLSGVVATP